MIKDKFDSEAGGGGYEALRRFDELNRRKREQGLTDDEKRDFKALLRAIYDQRQLVLVSPSDAGMVQQLHGWGDKVHPLSGEDELLSRRIGGAQDNKRVYALAVPDKDGNWRLLAAIYTHWSRPAGDGRPDDAMLSGNVETILKEPVTPLDHDPRLVTFYSISSFLPGAGKQLLADLGEALSARPEIRTVTLSPLRTFAAWLAEGKQGSSAVSADPALRGKALEYLLANQDPVQKFHMGNGAYIGNIHLRANKPGSFDDTQGLGVMVNYVYPRSAAEQARNRDLYQQGRIAMAGLLFDHINTRQYPQAFRAGAGGPLPSDPGMAPPQPS